MTGATYAHLNLKWNPFGAMTRAEKQALTVPRLDLAPYIDRLRAPGYALQFLPGGEKRKTTHLLWLRDHFPGAPYICLSEKEREPVIPEAPVIFLDQLQEMPLRRRLALFRRPASFALVSHRNHRLEFRLAGLRYDLLPLPTYNPAQFKETLDRRLAGAPPPPASWPGLPAPVGTFILLYSRKRSRSAALGISIILFRGCPHRCAEPG